MSVAKLRKLKKNEAEALAEIFIKSDYCFDNIKIKNVKINDVINFVEKNVEDFHVLLLNGQIKGFSFSYCLNKMPLKYDFFKNYFSIIQKLTLKFSKKFNNIKLNSNDYIVDFIYFDKDCIENYSMFIKYLEVEKLRNNSPNLFTYPKYLTDKEKGKETANFESLALYNLVQKI